MKKIIYLSISFLLIYAVILVSCKPKPIPTEPGFTPTKTFTNMPTNTEKPVNTVTQTHSSTFIFSETFTPTSTETYTVTMTVTITSTKTPTQTITPTLTPTVCTIYYYDADQDGFGKCDDYICSTSPYSPYIATICGDCNDNDAQIWPGYSEICGDGKDNNCDGNIDEGCSP
mgnify:CR=1 FL=1